MGTDKYYINRHDIDTFTKVAREIFEIEKEVYGQEGTVTYYFRNSTSDKKLIGDIEEYGYETGYHYEELATYEKQIKSKSAEGIRASLPQCRKMFVEDIERFRLHTGSKSCSVASHGDFINTKYKIQNVEILRDTDTRIRGGI